MNGNVKQNLIPDEIKERYSKKYLAGLVVIVGVFLLISIAVPYISMGIVTRQIDRIEKKNEAYEYQQQEIYSLNSEIEVFNKIINEYEAKRFPFSQFLFELEALRPATVHIISVDTSDRLINEGAADEKDTTEKKAENEEEAEPTVPTIKFEKDLCQQKITIRGYGSSQKDISDYLHSLSELNYVSRLNVVAIEQHKIENGVYNIFEATAEGWEYYETQIP